MKLDLDRTPAGSSHLALAGDLALDLAAGGPGEVRLTGEVGVDNLEKRFLVRGELRARGRAECGRCLAEFELDFAVPVEIIVLRSEADADDDDEDDSMVIHQRTGEVDLSTALREAAILAVPQAKVCRPDCRGLCPRCGADWNQGPCDCPEDEPSDPRWEGLPDA
jgi:uncharacterized protein